MLSGWGSDVDTRPGFNGRRLPYIRDWQREVNASPARSLKRVLCEATATCTGRWRWKPGGCVDLGRRDRIVNARAAGEFDFVIMPPTVLPCGRRLVARLPCLS